MNDSSLLGGLHVVDLSGGVAGAYCTKLLAEAGAEVIKVEPPAGDPLRRWTAGGAVPDGDGALFQYLHTSKRSWVCDGDPLLDPAVSDLLARADLVVEGRGGVAVDVDELRRRHPGLHVVSVTPFGHDAGPEWTHRPISEFLLQALCGSIASRGRPDREPLQAGGRLGEWIAGAYAAVVAVAIAVADDGPRHADVSMLEAMCLTMAGATLPLGRELGQPQVERSVELPSVELTEDGFVGFCTITRQQFSDFLVMIGASHLTDDDELATYAGRQRRREQFVELVETWTRDQATDDVIELASAFRIPVTSIGTPSTLAANEHFVARDVFVPQPGAAFRRPRPPYQLRGAEVPPLEPAPALGEHTGQVGWEPRNGDRPSASGGTPLPLHGVSVVDLTAFWAGPSATHLLAALGADVIKIESIQRPDGMRFSTARGPEQEEQWWEWSPIFQWMNVNKRSVTLDLSQPDGREAVLDLIDRADVVIENFSPRVLDQHGLTWELLHERNPRLVMVRMPAFGLDGPWRDRTGFAQTMEQLSGMAWMTGYEAGPPIVPKGPVDPAAGIHAAFATISALRSVRRSGEGVFVEAPMVETALNVSAELLLEHEAYGRELSRAGNRGPAAAPQGVHPCSGDDQWVAIAVSTDAEWSALRALLADDDLPAADADLPTRRAGHDRIDAAISAWTGSRERDEAERTLLAAGVPAAAVRSPYEMYELEPLARRRFVEEVDHPLVGRHPIMTVPFRLDGVEHWIDRPAPTLGQHSREVLTTLVGLSANEIDDMEARHVTGTRLIG